MLLACLHACVLACVLRASLAAQPPTCPSYADVVRPLLLAGDVRALQRVFRTINDRQHGVVRKSVPPVERSVVADKRSLLMLVSLSRPLVETAMNQTDLWPANNHLSDGEAVEGELPPELPRELAPLTTVHAGVRYVHGCQQLQQRSCYKKLCEYRADMPLVTVEAGKQIFVPLDNLIAADGSDMAGHLQESSKELYHIVGFDKMAVEECFGRQLFVKLAEDNCFNSSKFFSLPERVESYHWGAGRVGVAEKTAFFVVMS